MPTPIANARHGSIYVLTLVTVLAITSIVLIGVSLRSMSNEKIQIVQKSAVNGAGVYDGIELAMSIVEDEIAAATWVESAKKGTVFPETTVGQTTLTSTVADAAGGAPTDFTTQYRVGVKAVTGNAARSAQIDMQLTSVDYVTFLSGYAAVAYWPFNETSNPAKADEKINSLDGTWRNPAVAGADTNDEGAPVPVFSSVNDEVRIQWDNILRINDGAFLCWMKYTGSKTFTTYSLAGKKYGLKGSLADDDDATNPPCFNISIINTAIYAYIWDSGTHDSDGLCWTRSNVVIPGQWQHLAITWGAEGMFVYVDGVEEDWNKWNTRPLYCGESDGTKTPKFRIGSGYVMDGLNYPKAEFPGSIAHPSFHEVQLTAAQVAEIASLKPDGLDIEIIDQTWARVIE